MNKNFMSAFMSLLITAPFFTGCNEIDEKKPFSLLQPTAVEDENMSNIKSSDFQALNEIRISYSPTKNAFVLNEPVTLDFNIENRSNQTINLNLGADRKEVFLFTVVSPSGEKIVLPQLTKEGISRLGILSLEPQQTYSQKILLNEWFEFNFLGDYELEIRLANQFQAANKIALKNLSFRTTFKIEPENPNQLQEVCATLAEQLMKSEAYAEAAEAALILSYVKDPIAIPYLEKAIASNKMVESITIAGLGRIADYQSVQALIRVMNANRDSELSALAKAALVRIKGQSSSIEIKNLITRTLDP